jgi:hypothetical protein
LFTASGASSPITITGLTEVAFTATVVAVNSYGPSASSAASNSVTPLPTIGAAFGGGFFAGQISTAGNGIADYNIVIGPLSTAQSGTTLSYKNVATAVGGGGAASFIDGPQNTANMVADGNATVYPCAHFCNDLTTGGQSDWYMPAQNEIEVCYFNLKPTTTSNNTGYGTNSNAVPARASVYTAGTPAQTTAADFVTSTGAEAFSAVKYWSSTEAGATQARSEGFSNGQQGFNYGMPTKNSAYLVRAIRRVAV